jgi:SWI/SNF-related matrix-associated actin-dependent regulator of chromatin subfamily A3
LAFEVAPVSILSNWEKQISDHCVPGKVSTYLYYGNNRSISAEDLQRYDIVITTYQTIAGEHAQAEGSTGAGPSKKKKKVERTLFDVAWKVSFQLEYVRIGQSTHYATRESF